MCIRDRNRGYELRKALLLAKGATDYSCIRGTVYQLLNALSLCNANKFMESVLRVYCSTKLQVPNEFVECLGDQSRFKAVSYTHLTITAISTRATADLTGISAHVERSQAWQITHGTRAR